MVKTYAGAGCDAWLLVTTKAINERRSQTGLAIQQLDDKIMVDYATMSKYEQKYIQSPHRLSNFYLAGAMSDQFPEQFVRWDTFSSALWYRTRAARYRLEGTRCTKCSEKFFPPRTGPICPACHERAMEPYQCAQTGEVVTVALDDVGFPALGYGDDAMPRVQVIIRLDDGIHLMVDIVQVADPSEALPGSHVKMVLRKHKREATGAWV